MKHNNNFLHYLALIDNEEMINATIDACSVQAELASQLRELIDKENNAGKSPVEFSRRFKQVYFGRLTDYLLSQLWSGLSYTTSDQEVEEGKDQFN